MECNKDCNFELININECYQTLKTAINNKRPFSFLRLGDGEGALLDFNSYSSIELVKYLGTHFGDQLSLSSIEEIAKNLKKSIVDADILGVRDDIVNVKFTHNNIESSDEFLRRFKASFHLRNVDKNLPLVDAKRIAMLHKNLTDIPLKPTSKLFSQWAHYDLHAQGALASLLKGEKKLGLINANSKVAKAMENGFGVPIQHIAVSDKFELQNSSQYAFYPNSYNKATAQLDDKLDGMVFIVAAGLVGKSYCYEIKQRGGIALDFGALVDCWAGKFSRPRVLQSKFAIKTSLFSKKKQVPDELKLTKKNIEQLSKKWESSL
jgi:hypothetical protein